MYKYSKLIKQLFFFGIVGGVSFLIDLAVTSVLYHMFHLPAALAGIIGFLSAFFFNFPINRKHVFQHTEHDRFSLKTQVILFISLSVFNIAITGVATDLLVNTAGLPISFTKVITTGMIAIWNFVLFKAFIFSKKPPELLSQ